MIRDSDILGSKEEQGRKRLNYSRQSRGQLHDLLSRGLPDLCINGVCDLRSLADALGMTYAGVHKWVRPGVSNQIPPAAVKKVVDLSSQQIKGGKAFKPLVRSDFLPFLF